MCVGAVVPWLDPQAGVIVTQAMTNVNFGPTGLDLLRRGLTAEQTLDALIATDESRQTRQLAVVDRSGHVSAWTGAKCIREAGHHIGNGYSIQANMMSAPTVIGAMKEAFESCQGNLAERMLCSLQAAQSHGGDIRGMQSAALKVVDGGSIEELTFRIPDYDLRVDEHDEPLEELARLVRLRKAKLIDAEGHNALEQGDLQAAREAWSHASALAPELVEISFWQAVSAIEEAKDVQWAAEIFSSELGSDEHAEHWIDLIFRLEECGILSRQGSAAELVDVIRTY
jgi:uncharacterized Ntn-hydrolase superfamily protein